MKMYKTSAGKVNNTTIERVKNLFEKVKYQYSFNREDFEKIFSVKKSRVSEIISKLLDLGLIEDSEPTRYKFRK